MINFDNHFILTLKNMRSEDKLLFACTRQEFLEEYKKTVFDVCRNGGLNWDVVYSTAESHGVAPLVYSNLKKCDNMKFRIPKEIIGKFNHFFLQNVLFKKVIEEKITELLSFFNSKNIDVMLVKGSSLDILVYESKWNICSSDVDIILKKRREELTYRERSEYHFFLKKIACLENEYFEHHDLNGNGIFPIDFKKIWERTIKIDYMGKYAFVLSPEDMLIFARISSYRRRFFRLKTLCDIAEIIKKYSGINWEDVTSRAKKYGCNNMVYAALITTKMTLGCHFPDEALYKLNVRPVRAKVISYLGRRMSFCPLSSLYSGINLLGAKVNLSLILPYATNSWHQVWGNMKVGMIRNLF